MSRYKKYKDSGVDWIGAVPEHWKITRLKNVSNYIQTGITPPSEKSEYYDGDIPWFGPGGFDGNTIISSPSKYITDKAISDGEAKVFPIDCIFMVGIGATIGKVGIIKKQSSCNQQLNVINFKNIVNPDFGVLQLKMYESIILNIANFSTLPIYNQVQTGNLKFAVPPISEQNEIQIYLDDQTQKIDRLITNKKAQAEKLKELRQVEINNAVTKGLNPNVKMNDSGIDWLGEIPNHWEVKRLKNIADVKYGLGQPPDEKEDGLPLIRATNVERGIINDKDLIFVDPADVPYDRDPVLKENDIIVVRSGAYTADSAIIPKKYDGAIAGYDMVMRVVKSFPLFISFSLLSNYLLVNQLFLERLRAAQPHLNKEELSKALIVVPPLIEQIQIANYLVERTTVIDNLLHNIENQIEKLQELRKTKIYEAVTGKIKVNSHAETTA